MRQVREFTIRHGLGIRLYGDNACRVIRKVKDNWVEIGEEYSLPVDPSALIWTRTGIPATVLAVALRMYELEAPGSRLRAILTGRTPFTPAHALPQPTRLWAQPVEA